MSTQCTIEYRQGPGLGLGVAQGQGLGPGLGRQGGMECDWINVQHASTTVLDSGIRSGDRGEPRQTDLQHDDDDDDDDRDEMMVLRCTLRLPLINEENLTSKSLGVQDSGSKACMRILIY